MQIVSIGDTLHEMSKPILWGKINLSSAECSQRVITVNKGIFIIKLNRSVATSDFFFISSSKIWFIWVWTWENEPSDMRAPYEDSSQPAHPRCLIRVFVVRMKKLCILGYPKCAHWRFRSACAKAFWIFAGRKCPKVLFLMFRCSYICIHFAQQRIFITFYSSQVYHFLL